MENPYDAITLSYLQRYVTEAEIDKGHIDDGIQTKVMILMEESGELAKALRIFNGMRVHDKTARHNLSDEFGDVLYLLMALANRCNINLAEALITKIAKDEKKIYKPAEKEVD